MVSAYVCAHVLAFSDKHDEPRIALMLIGPRGAAKPTEHLSLSEAVRLWKQLARELDRLRGLGVIIPDPRLH